MGPMRDSVIGDKLRKVDLAVISDVHLGTDGCQAEALLQYLDRLRPRVLVLNGDILDGWMMNPLNTKKMSTPALPRKNQLPANSKPMKSGMNAFM